MIKRFLLIAALSSSLLAILNYSAQAVPTWDGGIIIQPF